MIALYKSVFQYIKSPFCEPIAELAVSSKLKIVGQLLVLSLILGIVLASLIGIVSHFGLIDLESHSSNSLIEDYSPMLVILLVAVLAPVIEELIFRAPITAFKSNPKAFKYVFYGFALVFGFIHIYNYELSPIVLALSPILVAPQIVLGLILGYLRVRLGLLYSILLHMSYNAVLVIPTVLFMD